MSKAKSRHNLSNLISKAGSGAGRAKSDVSTDTPWLRYRPGTIEAFPISDIDLGDTSFRFRDFDSKENKEFVDRLEADLRENKEQEDAVLLVFRPPKKKAVIVDGWTRVMALKKKGATTVLARFADYQAKDLELEKRRFRRHSLRRDYALPEIFAYFKKKKEQGHSWSVREMQREFGYPHVTCALISRALNDPTAAKQLMEAKSSWEARQIVHAQEPKAGTKKSAGRFFTKRVAGLNVAKGKFKIVIESRDGSDAEAIFKDAVKWLGEELKEIKTSLEAAKKD